MVGRYGNVRDDNYGREPVDVEMVLRAETAKAVNVALDEAAAPVWLPRSLVQISGKGPLVVVTMPQWLAEREGLI